MSDDYTRDPAQDTLAPGAPSSPAPGTLPTATTTFPVPGTTETTTPGTGGDDASGGVGDRVKEAASSAGAAGASVADEARRGASDVTHEAQRQARDLWDQARSEVADQSGAQQQRLAGGLRSFGGQLGEMADAPAEPGVATDLARQLGRRADDLGRWLEDHGPEDVLDEVRSFARRRPGTFLLAAAGVGLVVGRLTRGLKDGGEDPGSGATSRSDADASTSAAAAYQPASSVSDGSGAPATGTASAPLYGEAEAAL